MNAKENNKTQDMGTGSIPKLLAQLAIPAVVAQIINLLYTLGVPACFGFGNKAGHGDGQAARADG